jgi:hypothetical protein
MRQMAISQYPRDSRCFFSMKKKKKTNHEELIFWGINDEAGEENLTLVVRAAGVLVLKNVYFCSHKVL